MSSVAASTGVPRKVLAFVNENFEVHMDCIAAGPDSCCGKCLNRIARGFDHFYGHLPSARDKLSAIAQDFHDEDLGP